MSKLKKFAEVSFWILFSIYMVWISVAGLNIGFRSF